MHAASGNPERLGGCRIFQGSCLESQKTLYRTHIILDTMMHFFENKIFFRKKI